MRDIDEKVVSAQNDTLMKEKLINECEVYIVHTAHKAAGRYISKNDDEWSIALLAFNEAIDSYDFNKGAFFPFAEIVIRRRIIDYMRKQSKHSCEVPVDSYTIENEEEDIDMSVKREVMEKTAKENNSDAKLEIEQLKEAIEEYGFSFMDLVSASPKAEKTKFVCKKAISYIEKNPILMQEMRRTKTLPLKIIEKNAKLPRKVLERHRKYIIAGALIVSGDYQILSEYFRFVKEER